jgi:hypothetical protein
LGFTLVGTEVQSDFGELFEYKTDMYSVFAQRITVNKDVVEVGRNEVVKECLKNVVDKELECGGGINESIGHDQGFEETISGAESCLPFFTFGHAHQVGGVLNIESGVVTGLRETVQSFADQGERVTVLNSAVFEFLVGHTKTQSAILCVNEQYWSSSR